MSTIERALERLGDGDPLISASSPPSATAVATPPHTPEQDAIVPTLEDNDRVQAHIELNFQALKSMGMVTPESGRSQVEEEYRHVKRPLLLNAFGEGALPYPCRNMIMVTSARPNEGKTFTAINLALSMALERDRTVLLVDADVAKPSVAKMLNFPMTAGLVDYLADNDRHLADLILKTNLPKLRILPAGRHHAHSTELLASENMKHLAQELAMRYLDRVVIFDSPPLLATSEAAVLAGLVGQVVMVVEEGKTKREELKEALELVGSERYIGLVLNKASRPFGADYYYYGAYSGYGNE